METCKSNRIRLIRKRFTLVEILIIVVIIMILFAMLQPALKRAIAQAKFTRWFAFNRNCANDPACVVNFNFQEGAGDILNNICAGADVQGYNTKDYCGYLRNTTGGTHNFKWIKSGGRWGRYGYKNALQFNGADTYVLVPTTRGLDFTPEDDFTVLCWVKFDKLSLGDCPFSKSLWGTATDAACQYDLYSNPWAGSFGQGSFDVDVFTTCATWLSTDVDFEEKGWIHLALRYQFTGTDATTGDAEGEISVFVNGQALGDFIDTTEENPGTASATGWKACVDLHVPLILGGAGCYRKYWSPSTYDPSSHTLENEWLIKFLFKGKMDEYLVYKRALPDSEIRGHYDMGKE